MASFVILGRWTSQGIQKIEEGPKRLDEVKEAFQDRGVQTKSFHLTLGRYDFVMTVEAKNSETLAAAILSVVSKGNASTETLRAFTEGEYRSIVKEL
ncbi:MAG TPA: GYD domain-containing protein [Gemmatimonadota bacterium]|nr:GYD domain-containing protein [Gemmatimonadota bacterium]